MLDYKTRLAIAQGAYSTGQKRAKNNPAPTGQKFAPGQRVHITDDLPRYMSHFRSGVNATVKYTYAHAYGGDDVKSYCLDLDGHGECSWYEEDQLTPIDDCQAATT